MKTHSFLMTCAFTVLTTRAHAGAEVSPEDWADMRAKAPNVVHLELVTGVVTNALTVNYERTLTDLLSVRVGYGASAVVGAPGSPTRTAHGPLAMLTLLLGDRSCFELGLGASVVTSRQEMKVGLELGGTWHAVPNFTIGYRYRGRGGPVFRAGLAWVSAYGVPLSLGFGWAF